MVSADYELSKGNQQTVHTGKKRFYEVLIAESTTDNSPVSRYTTNSKNIWIKSGDVLLLTPFEDDSKVKPEAYRVLTPDPEKRYRLAGLWPSIFIQEPASEKENDSDDDDSDYDSDTSDEE